MSATKKCNKCYVQKSVQEFYKTPANTGGRFYTCVACITIARKVRWFEVFKYKGSKCEHCGISDLNHPEIYEYHHKDPALKKGTVGSMLSSFSDETLYAEVDKCILVCANCHSIEHKRISDRKSIQ